MNLLTILCTGSTEIIEDFQDMQISRFLNESFGKIGIRKFIKNQKYWWLRS